MSKALRIIAIIATLAATATISGCSFLGGSGPEFTNWEPQLSPDGAKLTYESPVDGSLELFSYDLQTGEVHRLTKNAVDDWSPSWSPDGTRIVFASNRDKNVDIYVLDLDTLAVSRVTTDEKDDINPTWGSDGRIYFNSNRTGVWEIYSIDPDGGNLVKVTETGE